MNRVGAFSEYYPPVLLVFYIFVIAVSVTVLNPVFTVLTFLGGLAYGFFITERSEYLKTLWHCLILIVLISVINPLFSHHGSTPLFFMNGRPITLEAFFYGVQLSLLVASVLVWCGALSKSFTSDKIVYLIGKPFPQLAVVITLAIRFVPMFKRKFFQIHNCQKCMGVYTSESLTDKLSNALKAFSAEVTWAFESSVDTAVSMNCRGYGAKKRTAFSLFRFTTADAVILTLNVVLFAVVIFAVASKSAEFYYYPQISCIPTGIYAVTAYISYGIMVFIPFAVELKEVLVWKYLKSRI